MVVLSMLGGATGSWCRTDWRGGFGGRKEVGSEEDAEVGAIVIEMPRRVPAYLQYNQYCQTDGAESSDAQQKKSRGLNRGMAGVKLLPGEKFPLRINRKKWTDWRNVLWNIYYIHDSENARLQACPKEISQDHWKFLMEYFDCEKSKAESFANANNHAQQMMLQTLGTKSLAYFCTEQSTDGNGDIDVARLDMWIKTHRIVRCSSRKEDVVPIITKLRDQALKKPADAHEMRNHMQKLPKDAGCAPIYGLDARVGNIAGSKLSQKSLVLQNEALDQRVRRLEQFMEAQGWCKDDA
ncbi:hypothetical protein EJ110_NYTH39298 [Nymphaea thermarum]|nr:hypothetical protein EJ110_NYTH39298 [Nymphaea thermarum]